MIGHCFTHGGAHAPGSENVLPLSRLRRQDALAPRSNVTTDFVASTRARCPRAQETCEHLLTARYCENVTTCGMIALTRYHVVILRRAMEAHIA